MAVLGDSHEHVHGLVDGVERPRQTSIVEECRGDLLEDFGAQDEGEVAFGTHEDADGIGVGVVGLRRDGWEPDCRRADL